MNRAQIAGVGISLGFLAFLTGTSMATITYVTQSRYIVAGAWVNGQPENTGRTVAPDFDDFDRTRTVVYSHSAGTGTASQTSRLRTDGVFCDGSAEVTVSGLGNSEPHVSSTLDVTFDLDVSSPFFISQSHEVFHSRPIPGTWAASAVLTGPAGIVFNWTESNTQASTWPVGPFQGTFDAGRYSLHVESTSDLFHEGAVTLRTGAMFSLTVPAPRTGLAVFAMSCVSLRRFR